MPELRYKGSDDKKCVLALRAGMEPVLVGRTGDVGVLLPNSSVSRKHCEIRSEAGGFVIEDLKSANGTRVNGDVLKVPHTMVHGDHILCGEVSVYFSDETQQAAKPSPGGLKRRDPSQDRTVREKPPESKPRVSAEAPAPRIREKSNAPAAKPAPRGRSESSRVKMLSRVEARLGSMDKGSDSAELGQVKKDAAQLAARLSTIEKERDDWKARAEASASDAEALEVLKDAQTKREEVEAKLGDATTRLDELTQENRELDERAVRYSMQLESVTEKYKDAREELDRIKERLDEERSTRGDHEDKMEDLERQIRLQSDELEEVRTLHAGRDKQMRELKIKVTERDRTIHQLQEQNAELEYERNESREEADRLQSTYNRDADETQRMEKRLEQLREVIRDKENLVTELRSELEEKDRQVIEVRMGHGIQGIEEERQSLMEDFYRKSRELESAGDKISELERQATTTREELDSMRSELREVGASRDNAKSALQEHESKQKESDRELARVIGRNEDLEKHLQEMEETLSQASPEMLKASEARVRSLTLELEESREKIAALRAEVREGAGGSGGGVALASEDVVLGYERVQEHFISLRSNLSLFHSFARDIQDSLEPVISYAASTPEFSNVLEASGVVDALAQFDKVKTVVDGEADQLKRELASYRNLLGGE